MIRLLLVFLFCVTVQAQEVILLEGKVLNDTIERASLTVVNMTLKQGSVTNQEGIFEIPVRLNDTINISAVQYESRQFVVSQTIFKRRKVSLYLVPKITQLGEVNISNSLLNGDLTEDATNPILKSDLESIEKGDDLGLLPDLPKKTKEERQLHTATKRPSDQVGMQNFRLDISLDAILNGLSGRTKKLKKHIAISAYQSQVQDFRNSYPDSLLVSLFKIPEVSLDAFLFYALQDDEVAVIKANDPLRLLDLLVVKAMAYRELKEEELGKKN